LVAGCSTAPAGKPGVGSSVSGSSAAVVSSMPVSTSSYLYAVPKSFDAICDAVIKTVPVFRTVQSFPSKCKWGMPSDHAMIQLKPLHYLAPVYKYYRDSGTKRIIQNS
jgi:hypothetical protein